MSRFKIGIMIDCLGLSFEDALVEAAKMGADGFQYSFMGDTEPDKARVDVMRAQMDKHGLVCSAICAEMGDFCDPEKNKVKLARFPNIFKMAKWMGTRVLTGHIGHIPSDKNDPVYKILLDALTEIGKGAMENDMVFAIETGPETTEVMRMFLEDLPGGVGINYDPANLVMAGYSKNGADSVAPVGPYIAHTHAKDGLPYSEENRFREVPLGEGHVDFPAWLKALEDAGYSGFLTIEREVGQDRIGDTSRAVQFLRNLIDCQEE